MEFGDETICLPAGTYTASSLMSHLGIQSSAVYVAHGQRRYTFEDPTEFTLTYLDSHCVSLGAPLFGGSESVEKHHVDDLIHPDAPSAISFSSSEVTTNTSGTTSFIDNAGTSVGQARTNNNIGSLGPPQYDANAIADFLAKPTLLWTGDVLTSSTANSTLFFISVATALQSNTIWMNKIQGYNLFRGTAVVKVTANANPYQQGRLLLHFLPNMLITDTEQMKLHNFNLAQKTQHPSVTLDFNETSAELRIPYVTPTTYYSFKTGGLDWGTMFLTVLSPLRVGSGAPTSVPITIFLSFEDVELSAPYYEEDSSFFKVNKDYLPQSSGSGKFTNLKPKRTVNLDHTQSDEAKSDNSGFLSSACKTGSNIAGYLSKVPVVGGIADVASDILGGVGSVFSAFGFQRPTDLDKPTVILEDPYRHQMNCSGRDAANHLTLNPDSHLEIISGWAGASADEMSFNFLKGIPALLDRFDVTTSQVSGTLLASYKVNPIEQSETILNAGTTSVAVSKVYGPMGYLSKMFAYWRGGITYTFKFVKTPSHSCRLAFIFSPVAHSASITLAQSDYCIRDIVDIRTDSELTFTVPYLRNTPYLPLVDLTSISTDPDVYSGTLFVRVLNTLQAPTICAQSFEVLTYVSAAPDFELAVPTWNFVSPPFIPQAEFEPQAGTTLADMGGDSKLGSMSSIHNDSVIGDKFTSIKQLLNMLCRVSAPAFVCKSNLSIYPQYMGYCSANLNLPPATALLSPAFGGDYYNLLSLGYSLCRGGVHLSIPTAALPSGSNPVTNSVQIGLIGPSDPFAGEANGQTFALPTPNYVPFGQNIGFNPLMVGPTAQTLSTKNQLDVIVPHGALTSVRIVRPVFRGFGFTQSSFTYNNIDQSRLNVVCKIGTTYDNIYRAGADDYALGYFIGFPPVLEQIYTV